MTIIQKEVTVEVTVPLKAIPQPRPKARRIGMGIQIYTPNSTKIHEYKAALKDAFLFEIAELGLEEELPGLKKRAIEMSILFFFSDPAPTRASFDEVEAKGLFRRSVVPFLKKPDLDNLAKGVLDALNEVAWEDDSQVSTLHLLKAFTPFKLGGKSGRKVEAEDDYIKLAITYLIDS